MIWRSRSLFIAAGFVTLALGMGLHTSGNFSHFASGFLLGVSIALLILGLARHRRRVSR